MPGSGLKIELTVFGKVRLYCGKGANGWDLSGPEGYSCEGIQRTGLGRRLRALFLTVWLWSAWVSIAVGVLGQQIYRSGLQSYLDQACVFGTQMWRRSIRCMEIPKSVSQVNAARVAKEDSTLSQRSWSEEPRRVEGPGMKWVLGVSEWPPCIGWHSGTKSGLQWPLALAS